MSYFLLEQIVKIVENSSNVVVQNSSNPICYGADMFFIYSLEKHEFFLLLLLIAILAAVFYYFAVKSRKSYTCPECGEKVRVEHMSTSRCSMCGSLLKQDDEEE